LRIALLSCGPSLSLYRPDNHATIIGVNTAATAYRCDWWSAGDDWTVETYKPIGMPHIYTLKVSYDRLESKMPQLWRERQVLAFETLAEKYGASSHFCDYSCPASLMLAVDLGATSVDVFGVDLRGGNYFNGKPGALLNNPHRWEQESKIWFGAETWAKSRGVAVVRHGAK